MNAILNYIRASRQELNKVTWLTRDQAINSTITVVVVSIVLALFLGTIDYGLNRLLEWILSVV